ncbi:MAG: FHA domain-containing protein, partial [Planctomycetes bacterium]|nr:FHA domain-containing protein [Planctomycetota bacterium]
MAKLIVTDSVDERLCELGDALVTIGRHTKSTVVIRDQNSSREHCQIRRAGDAWSIIDLNSRNGTLVNGCPINEHRLRHGDRIEIGNTTMVYVSDGASGVAPLPPRPAPKGPPPLRPEHLRPTREEQCAVEISEGEHAGKKFYLGAEPLSFGRAKTNTVVFADDRVSSRHAEIAYDPLSGMYLIRDLGSTNGTKVDGAKVKAAALRSGSVIELGGLKLVFTDPKAPANEDEYKTPPSLI